MGKWVADAVLDAALNHIKNNSTRVTLCNAQPADYSKAVNDPSTSSGNRLADVSISSADFGSPQNGDVSGRKIQVDAQSSISVDVTGTVTHLAMVDVSSTVLLYVTTVSSQAVTAGNKANIPAWDIEFRDPS